MQGLIFTSENVLKIIAGEKTQTRRAASLRGYKGKAGDTFRVKESYAIVNDKTIYKATCKSGKNIRWKTPLFMPIVRSRIHLDIKEIRIERLQSISEADCKAEGVDSVEAYAELWDAINSKKPGAPLWKDNPFVSVITFHGYLYISIPPGAN